jgi:hypothetical protein
VIATGRIMQTVIDRSEMVALRRLGTVEDCAKVVESTVFTTYARSREGDLRKPRLSATLAAVIAAELMP